MTDEPIGRPTVEVDLFLRYVERFTLEAIDRYTDVPVERESLRRSLALGIEPIGDAEWSALGEAAVDLVNDGASDLELAERPRSTWTTAIAEAVVNARLSDEQREVAMRSRIAELSASPGTPGLSNAEWRGYLDRAQDVDSEEARAIPNVQWDAVVDTPGAEFGFVSLENPRGVDEATLARSIALAHNTRRDGVITFENENRRWDSLWLERRDYVELQREQRLRGLREAGIAVADGSPQARHLTRDLRDPEPVVSRAEAARRQARYGATAATTSNTAESHAGSRPGVASAPRTNAAHRAPEADPSRVVPAAQQQQQQRSSLLRRITRR